MCLLRNGIITVPYKPTGRKAAGEHAGLGIWWWFAPRLTALGLDLGAGEDHMELVKADRP